MTSSTKSPDKKSKPQTIQTSRFGELEINKDKIITMVSPFLGFPDEKHFILLPHGAESVFWWLQSTENPSLAFVVIQPSIINDTYNPDIHQHFFGELKVSSREELDLLIILTIPQGQPEQMTANLLGPVLFNAPGKLAKQILLDPAQYDPCWPVMQNR